LHWNCGAESQHLFRQLAVWLIFALYPFYGVLQHATWHRLHRLWRVQRGKPSQTPQRI
jgi:hypothetical protein